MIAVKLTYDEGKRFGFQREKNFSVRIFRAADSHNA
jgi:hypothetical protein